MKVLTKVFLPIISLFSLATIGTGIFFSVEVAKVNNKDLIQLKKENMTVMDDCDLGIISPGEVKEQSYMVESLISKDVSFSISFTRDMYKLGYDYVSIDASLGDEKLDKVSFSSCFESSLTFKEKLKKNETKELNIHYTLAQDIPQEIIGTNLEFKLILETKAFL